jgi:THAP domain
MTRSCSVCFGSVVNKENLEFFTFPRDGGRRENWIIFTRNCRTDSKWQPKKHSKLCGRHFVPEDFVYAVPSVFTEIEFPATETSPQTPQRTFGPGGPSSAHKLNKLSFMYNIKSEGTFHWACGFALVRQQQ